MEVHGEDVMSQQNDIWKFCTEESEDSERSGRPTTARTSDIIAATENVIYINRRITVSE
jgi:hypothetical protein